ncbi:MAG: CoA transferase [Sphingopyxis sp.]|nr:CoA transferase [Sphingopyxis sp.]
MTFEKPAGPLKGIRIIEFTGIGPGPFATMLLSDLGAEVLRIDRVDHPGASPKEVTARGRASLALDLKRADAVAACLSLAERADVLIEGFRPGVMERLGLGPEVLLERNPRLVYGRMTGWGQSGPLSHAAGHDINYLAITGALGALGPADRPPPPPLNLVGDFGGGSLYLALGILASLVERQASGKGQVVDAAITDGAASLMAMACWTRAEGWNEGRESNFLDGSAYYYRCYECADGCHVSLGSIEPQFYDELRRRLGIAEPDWPVKADGVDAGGHAYLEKLFRTKTRAQWCALLEGSDACFAPVLDLEEAWSHPHNVARGTFVERFGVQQPAPAPRLSRTPGAIQGPPPAAGEGGRALARHWGVEIP